MKVRAKKWSFASFSFFGMGSWSCPYFGKGALCLSSLQLRSGQSQPSHFSILSAVCSADVIKPSQVCLHRPPFYFFFSFSLFFFSFSLFILSSSLPSSVSFTDPLCFSVLAFPFINDLLLPVPFCTFLLAFLTTLSLPFFHFLFLHLYFAHPRQLLFTLLPEEPQRPP